MRRTMQCFMLGILSLSLVACGRSTPKMSASAGTVSKSLTLPSLSSQKSKMSDAALAQPESTSDTGLTTTSAEAATQPVLSSTTASPSQLIYAKTPKAASVTINNTSTPASTAAKMSPPESSVALSANKSAKAVSGVNPISTAVPTKSTTTMRANLATQPIVDTSAKASDMQYTPTALAQNNAINPYLPPLEERPADIPPTTPASQSAPAPRTAPGNAATTTKAAMPVAAETAPKTQAQSAMPASGAAPPAVTSASTVPAQSAAVPAVTQNPSSTAQKPVVLPQQAPLPQSVPAALNRPSYESPYGRGFQNNNAPSLQQKPKGPPPQSFDDVPVPVLN